MTVTHFTRFAFLLALILGGTSQAFAEDPVPSATPQAKLPPLFLATAKGEVYLVHEGNKQKADPPQEVEADDRILTGKDGTAYLEFQQGGTVEVGPKSDLKIREVKVKPDTFRARFLMAFGEFKAKVKKLTSASSTFEVEAGGVVAGVRGTVFGVDYDQDNHQVNAQTYEGSIYAKVDGKESVVSKGFGLVLANGGIPVIGALTGGDLGDFVDFMNAAGDVEKQRDILLKKLSEKIIGGLLQNAQPALPKSPVSLPFHF